MILSIVSIIFGITGALPATAGTVADRAIAAERIRPDWVESGAVAVAPNESFISNLSCKYQDGSTNLSSDRIFSDRDAADMRQRYDDLNRSYEERRRQGLVDAEMIRAHNDQLQAFGRDVLSQVRRFELARSRDKINEITSRDENLREAAKPIAVAGALVALYSDRPFEFRLDDSTKIIAHASVPNQTGEVAVSSMIVNGAIDLNGRALDHNPLDAPPADPTMTQEKYRLSLSRDLGVFDLSSGVSYGSTTNVVTASLSKPLTPHLTCVLDTVHPLDTDVASEKRVKFLYGISF